MDPAGIGVLIGFFGLLMVGAGVYIYDTCIMNKVVQVKNPLLNKKRSFKVKNLFSHVEI